MKRLLTAGFAISAALAAAGCSTEPRRAEKSPDKVTPTVTETERPGVEAPSDISNATARWRVSDLTLGTKLDADGKIAQSRDNFPTGAAVLASLGVADVAAGSQIKAVWSGPGETRLHEEVKEVAAGTAFLLFKAPATRGWALGDYKIDIYLGDELAGTENFDIVARASR
jgi:hypothetical protein